MEVSPAARPEERYGTIRTLLSSKDPDDLRKGLALVEGEIARVGAHAARPLFEMVAAIFYLDPLDRPDLVPVLDEAVSLVVGFGEWVIPVLVDHLEAGDVKAQLAAGHALGRIGADAIRPLMAKLESAADPTARTFALYTLGKIRSPRVIETLPLVLSTSRSNDLELHDTAIRAIGRMAESIPKGRFPEEQRDAFVDRLHEALADTSAGVRAKAVRSLGKLARAGHLSVEERDTLVAVCRRLIGEDEAFEWDRAYIVRKEAEEALRNARL